MGNAQGKNLKGDFMKRRVLKLLLVVALLCCVIPVAASALEPCPSTGGDHWWSSGNTHSAGNKCVYCRTEAPLECEYELTYSSYGAADGHYEACVVCKEKKEGTDASHSMTAYVVGSAGSYHYPACSECGYYSAFTSEYCSESAKTERNETHHWQVCEKCNTEISGSRKKHDAATPNSDGLTHSVSCSSCGYNSTENCTYGDYSTNYSGHSQTCSCGRSTGTIAHVYDEYEYYSGGAHKVSCDCGYVKTYNESCTAYLTYVNNGEKHTTTCSRCGKVTQNQNHSYTDGICACGAEKHEHKWSYASEGNEITLTCTGTTGECEYNKNGGKLTITAADAVYDGNSHGAKVTGSLKAGSVGNITYYKKTGGSYSSSGINSAPKNAGTYKAEVKVTDGWHTTHATAAVEFTINQAELNVTATDYEGAYDGKAHGITLNVPEGKGLTVEYSEDGERFYQYPLSTFEYTDVCDKTVYYRVTDNSGNYKINGGTGSAFVKITKAKLEDLLKNKVHSYSGVYDGNSHGITVDAPAGITVTYSYNGSNYGYASQYNSFKNVGEYTVSYKASVAYPGDEKNYESKEVTGTATVTITQLDLATVLNVTAENTRFTYNRFDHETSPSYIDHAIKLEVKDKNNNSVSYVPGVSNSKWITVEYSKDGGANWSTQNPAFTDAGEYPVQYRIYVKNEDANIKGITGSKTVTIDKAELPITELIGYHGPYDGSTHYGFGYKYETGYGSYFTLYWYDYLHEELTYDFSWKDENGTSRTLHVEAGNAPELKNFPGFTKQNVAAVDTNNHVPGEHKVTVKIQAKNYEPKELTYCVQIGPAGAVAEDRTYVYDGEKHYIANYIAGMWYYGYGESYNFGSIKIEYREAGTDKWLPYYQEPGQTDVGYKDVEWKVTCDSDGNGEFGETKNSFGSREVFTGTNRVTVTPATLTVTVNSVELLEGQTPDEKGYGFEVDDAFENLIDDSGAVYTYTPNSDGTMTIGLSGLKFKDGSQNYTFKYVTGTVTFQKNEEPTGTISVADKSWNALTKATEKTYFNSEQAVTVTGADEEGEVTIAYLTSATAKTAAELEAMADADWTAYGTGFTLAPNQEVIVYAKITDETGASTYISTNTLVFDNIAPVIDGITNDTNYKDGAEFTVTDANLDKVTVMKGEEPVELTPDENGKYTLPNDNSTYTVIATDKARNSTTVTVTTQKIYDVTTDCETGSKVNSEKMEAPHGEDYKFTVEIEEGYRKKEGEFSVKVNGTEVEEDANGNYIFPNVTSDLKITVSGLEKVPTYKVTTELAEGSAFDGDEIITHEEDYEFTVTILPGYEKGDDFKVTVNGEEVSLDENGKCVIEDVKKDLKIVVSGVKKKIYTVTETHDEGSNVIFTPTVEHGSDYEFTVNILDGYEKAADFQVTVNGETVSVDANGKCVVENVTENLAIVVSGVREIPSTHKVYASHDEGCKVLGEPTVKDGETYRFLVTIDDGYKKGDNFKVTVNGKEVEPNLLGQYVIRNVHDDLHIEVSGVVKKSVAVVKKTGPTETPFTGDTFNLAFWGTVMASSFVLAVAAFVVLMKIMRNKGKHNK